MEHQQSLHVRDELGKINSIDILTMQMHSMRRALSVAKSRIKRFQGQSVPAELQKDVGNLSVHLLFQDCD